MTMTVNVTWSLLGSIGRSSISKLSILMPFIGYLILLQDKVVGLATPLIIHEGTDFRIGIGFYLLYFGLFVFGLGSFLFHVASPQTAKDFKSADDYVERLQSLISTSELIAKLDAILQNETSESIIYKEASLYKNTLSAGVGAPTQQPVKAFILRNFFDLKDRSRKFLLFSVLILFSAGIFLISVPSFIVLFRVIGDFSHNYL